MFLKSLPSSPWCTPGDLTDLPPPLKEGLHAGLSPVPRSPPCVIAFLPRLSSWAGWTGLPPVRAAQAVCSPRADHEQGRQAAAVFASSGRRLWVWGPELSTLWGGAGRGAASEPEPEPLRVLGLELLCL